MVHGIPHINRTISILLYRSVQTIPGLVNFNLCPQPPRVHRIRASISPGIAAPTAKIARHSVRGNWQPVGKVATGIHHRCIAVPAGIARLPQERDKKSALIPLISLASHVTTVGTDIDSVGRQVVNAVLNVLIDQFRAVFQTSRQSAQFRAHGRFIGCNRCPTC